MTNTENRIALVTGGSRGLGKDMALQRAHKGFDVLLTYQTKSDFAQEVVNEIKSIGKNGRCAVSTRLKLFSSLQSRFRFAVKFWCTKS